MIKISKNDLKKFILYSGWIISLSLTFFVLTLLPFRECRRCLLNFTVLLVGVAVAGFIGVALESRLDGRRLIMIVKPLLRYARLPDVTGRAWLLALFSGSAASVMLADARESGNITRREMYLSVLATRFPAMLSSSLRIIFPVIAAVGLVGIYYYLSVYGIELVILLLVVFYARFTCKSADIHRTELTGNIKKPSWNDVMDKSLKTSMSLSFRFLKVALPCYLLTALALRSGFQEDLRNWLPEFCRARIAPDMLLVTGARLGGMFSAAGVVAEMAGAQRLTTPEIVFSLLLGKIIMTPVRTLRTGIPVMAGIFKFYDGLRLALIISVIRLIVSVITAIIIYIFIL